MADRQTAEGEIGEQRLDVTQRDFAGGGVADVTDGRMSRQPRDDVLGTEILADQAEAAMGVKLFAVVSDNSGCFLPAMLQGMQPQCCQRRRIGMAVNPENAAFLPEMVVVPGVGGQHATAFMRASAARRPVAASVRWCRRPAPSRPTAFYTDCGTTRSEEHT